MTTPDPLAAARAAADAAFGNLLDLQRAQYEAAREMEALGQRIGAWQAAYERALRERLDRKAPLTVAEAAALLGVSERHVARLARRGELRKVQGIGSAVRIVRADVERRLAGVGAVAD